MLLEHYFNRTKETSGKQVVRLLAITRIGPYIRERILALIMSLDSIAPRIDNDELEFISPFADCV